MDLIFRALNLVADGTSALCLLAGAFFMVVGIVGILRMPDFFSRLHAGGITDTMGTGLILLALVIDAGFTLAAAKLLMILLFLFVTSPTACHALAHSALACGLEPKLGSDAAPFRGASKEPSGE